MTAQVWKRGAGEPRVTFRCPWCDVVGVSVVHGHYDHGGDVWLLAGCPHWSCGRGVLIRVPHAAPWTELETGEAGLLLAGPCVHPRQP